MDAGEYMLHLVTWQFFGTLTWRPSQLGTVRTRTRQVYEFLADWTRFRSLLPFHRLPLVVRWETGEIGERPHAHFVVTGLVRKFVTITSCFQANHEWNRRHGFAQVRLVGVSGAGGNARYLTKGNVNLGAGDRYEFRKFGSADRLEVNDAAWRLMLQGSGTAYKRQQSVS